jgi:hypothetical protein
MLAGWREADLTLRFVVKPGYDRKLMMNGPPFPEEAGLPAQDAPGLDAADLTSRDPRDAMSLQTALRNAGRTNTTLVALKGETRKSGQSLQG